MTAMPSLSSIGWDWADRMQSANLGGGGNVYFTYDSGGNRVRKVWDKTSTLRDERIYLGNYELWRESSVSGGTATIQEERQTVHVLDDVRRVAMIETLTVHLGATVSSPTPRQRFQISNQLESAVVEMTETGALISYEEYFAFGMTSFHSPPGTSDVPARRYRYNGKERDEETGLYYYGARYYAAWLGRWLSCDPSGADGPNRYSYVTNNPVSTRDPNGRFGLSDVKRWATHPPSPKEVIQVVRDTYQKGKALATSLVHEPSSALVLQGATAAIESTFPSLSSPSGYSDKAPLPKRSVAPPPPVRPSPLRLYTGPFHGSAQQIEKHIADPKTTTVDAAVGHALLFAFSGFEALEEIPNIPANFEQAFEHFTRGQLLAESVSTSKAFHENLLGIADASQALSSLSLLASLLRPVFGAGGTETRALLRHLENAIGEAETSGLTPRQAARAATNPRLEPAFRGERIHHYFSLSVTNDPNLGHLSVARPFVKQPDVFDPSRQVWWDVTTTRPGEWEAHVNKYTSQFGTGTPLLYDAAGNVTTFGGDSSASSPWLTWTTVLGGRAVQTTARTH